MSLLKLSMSIVPVKLSKWSWLMDVFLNVVLKMYFNPISAGEGVAVFRTPSNFGLSETPYS